MQTIFSIAELREVLGAERRAGKRIGFVPTMGNLHTGHIQLIHQSNNNADITVASIFVLTLCNLVKMRTWMHTPAHSAPTRKNWQPLAAITCLPQTAKRFTPTARLYRPS